ncbi:hypothetical protein MJO28_001694 [Puccinia striiformis f. sp. tritici]|uniref:Smr domain-containing protein n=2 Tax=Puccinia striiformis TaxID=27350 RepID=A0A2S4VEC4_9BASI|nr:hypothetical protein Pst134EA_003064 [Puccinia striiformis f. sp. tritici]KAI9629652.1 hypothetical protein KEM48_012716 [Puccinia striiformis f. sp. tritici PST-130]POW07750.1 hypothetical protein PSHT_09851 [Puccinia striiformis]KAH9464605.1 hypothetical protein Pst134EB_004129 [Puccinia striiformis f. sp. tritici]KAH9472450.1 hypothetical protein Pst134EA_003064 [Puccinia striiformis f. sp. tritici]KAI7961205.1 hypothetical protein MJO28_001694 [Puccinia striiformis f. sp. tritici]
MAFNIHDALRLFKKLKRWWDRRAHDNIPSGGEPPPTDDHHHQQPWGPPPPGHHEHQNQNQINSANPHFVGLRNQAISEGNLMKQKFDEAHRAYEQKDGGRAKNLSNEGKAHQERRNQLNKQAAEWIFKENNRHSPSDTIDLHGLYVQESLTYAETFINQAERNKGPDQLRIIVGKGLHSTNFQAKLKPAIEKLIHKHNLSIDFDTNHNSGVLLVKRNVPKHQIGLDRNLLDHLSSSDNRNDHGNCIIV